jgi:hypothetical protein
VAGRCCSATSYSEACENTSQEGCLPALGAMDRPLDVGLWPADQQREKGRDVGPVDDLRTGCVVSSAWSSCHPSSSCEVPPLGCYPSRRQRATPYVAPPVTATPVGSLLRMLAPDSSTSMGSRPRRRATRRFPPLLGRCPGRCVGTVRPVLDVVLSRSCVVGGSWEAYVVRPIAPHH